MNLSSIKFNLQDRGNISFYLIFVLPISLVFLIIGVEISQWQYLRQEAQREADKLALELGQSLPFKEHTKEIFLARAEAYNSISDNLKISYDSILGAADEENLDFNPGKIRVRITGQLDSILDSLMTSLTGEEVIFPIDESASARLVPNDLILIFSDAVSLRPEALTTFGNPLDFPPSDYFNFIAKPQIKVSPPPVPPRAWPNWWSEEVFNDPQFKRWSTQLCFNQSTLPLKQAILMLLDQHLTSKENRLGVYATPGDVYQHVGYSVIKEFNFSFDSSDVHWSNYFEPDVPNSDEGCVLYSHHELGLNRYPIPKNLSSWSEQETCNQTIISNPFLGPEGHYPNPLNSRLSDCFKEGGVSLREAIYYRAVRMHPHEVFGNNVARALKSGVSRLIEQEKSSFEEDHLVRKGLVGNANKILVLISDKVPSVSHPDLQLALKGLAADKKIKLYLFAFNHEALGQAEKHQNIQNIEIFKSLNNERLFARIVNEESLGAEIKALISNEKQVVLSS